MAGIGIIDGLNWVRFYLKESFREKKKITKAKIRGVPDFHSMSSHAVHCGYHYGQMIFFLRSMRNSLTLIQLLLQPMALNFIYINGHDIFN
jgi:hypothetical protein